MAVTAGQLKCQPHATYYANFFLLRTQYYVNGRLAMAVVDEESGELTLNSPDPEAEVPIHGVSRDVHKTLQRHGLLGVSNTWAEKVPLFNLEISGGEDLRKILRLQYDIREELALKFQDQIKSILEAADRATPHVYVTLQIEVFLFIRDSKRIILIEEDNIASCMELYAKSAIFDMGALFRAFRMSTPKNDDGPEKPSDLEEELEQHVGWYDLGLCFDVPRHILEAIRYDHQTHEMRRRAMFTWWLDNASEKTWSTVVQALTDSGSQYLAKVIATKHDVPVPSSCHLRGEATSSSVQDPPQGQSESSSALEIKAQIDKVKLTIASKDMMLAKKAQAFKLAQLEKKNFSESLSTLSQTLANFNERHEQKLKEKEAVEKNLKMRELELMILNEADEESVGNLVSLKHKELATLRKQSEDVEKELEETKQKISHHKKKEKITLSIIKQKSGEAEELQKAKDAVEQELEVAHRKVDTLRMQQTAAELTDNSVVKTVKVLMERQGQKAEAVQSGKSSVPKLVDLITDVKTEKWYKLGLVLTNYDTPRVDAIKANHPEEDAEAALLDTLMLWVETSDVPPTWQTLLAALRSVGETQLAESLEHQHCIHC